MAMQVKSAKDLVDPSKFKVKMLVYSLPGGGKTLFTGTAADTYSVGSAACETGHGNGLLTVGGKDNFDYVTPENMRDFEEVCKGRTFPDKDVLILDSLTDMCRTFVKDAALAMPRKFGDSDKRAMGVPELDDYGVMAELTRRLVAQLLLLDKHIIVTCKERIDRPNEKEQSSWTFDTPFLIGPDLPGQMFLGAPAMFDFVLRLRTRPKLADPKDAKSRYTERYFVTQPDGMGTIAKCRSNLGGVPLLDKEEVFDLPSGRGSFPYMVNKIISGYQAGLEKAKGVAA